ncbi:related to Oligosaccharide translocation protein RFT1 [Saccharomycodes ludwigii]|uniref:Man(5)GlcNAc(2)-PP-dolichol translocation protein RFT1 n=1 Tax=Saccharomycodes ludwigii TaxID=36035 RepID=A0A376BAX9_9ASCO|nr:hypothetical protein SCDLUD_001591 [Saccharomycodes ludwigii]KAH3901809.1 hypothetical protein SCDLUD_001591 [Saccharomycodes ludwigii]SSD61838.1 related to Oligosaccharide translocation protein RFT1 [Saccharomycodes ludwigii]
MRDESILVKSTKGVTFLMFTQLFTKILTFLLNNLLIRYLSPKIFGITAFLAFLQSTALFFSREAIRLSTLRISNSNVREKQQENDELSYNSNNNHTDSDAEIYDYDNNVFQSIINFSYIPIAIGFPLSLILVFWQYNKLNDYFINLPYFTLSIFILWCSIIIELLVEPFYNINQFMLNYKTRSQYEGIAVTSSCIINFLVVYLHEHNHNKMLSISPSSSSTSSSSSSTSLAELGNGHDIFSEEGIAILAFAFGKLFNSITLLVLYYRNYLTSFKPYRKFQLKLVRIKHGGSGNNAGSNSLTGYYFENNIIEHFKKVYFQLCFKHLLTEGDKLIINSLCTVEEQGIYSLLSNYGSLVTRLIFAPIEETLRLFLTRLLINKTNHNLKLSMEVLINITTFYLYLTIIIVIFGPINSSYMMRYLIGSKWSSTSVLETIRVYCFYLPFLSLNGILEAFFQSVADGDQILKHSYLMMLLSGVFLLNSWILIEKMKLSLEGLIYSNIINMVLRIGYCVLFINKFYKELFSGKSSLIVNFKNFKKTIILSGIIGVFDWYFLGGYTKNVKELVINIGLAMLIVFFIIYNERKMILSFVKFRREKTN